MTVAMKVGGTRQLKTFLLTVVLSCRNGVINSFHTSYPIQSSLSHNIQNPVLSLLPQYHEHHMTKLRFTPNDNIESTTSNIKSSNAVNNENTTSLLDPVLKSSISNEQDDF